MSAETAQARFNERYITSQEIVRRLNVSRASVGAARRRGDLPPAITIEGVNCMFWERSEAEPMIEEWQIKRSVATANAMANGNKSLKMG